MERSIYLRIPLEPENEETAKLSFTHGREFNHFVAGDCLGFLVYFVCNALRSRSTVRDVVLDTKVGIWATRVVAGRQEDAPSSFIFPNDIGSGRSGKDCVLSDDKLPNAIGRADLQDGLDSFG